MFMSQPWRGKAPTPNLLVWMVENRQRGAGPGAREWAKEMIMLECNRLRLMGSLLATTLFVAGTGAAFAADTSSQDKMHNQTTTQATTQMKTHKATKKHHAAMSKSRHESALDAKERAETKALNEAQLKKPAS